MKNLKSQIECIVVDFDDSKKWNSDFVNNGGFAYKYSDDKKFKEWVSTSF